MKKQKKQVVNKNIRTIEEVEKVEENLVIKLNNGQSIKNEKEKWKKECWMKLK